MSVTYPSQGVCYLERKRYAGVRETPHPHS